MSSESELESDEEFDRTFGELEHHLESVENRLCAEIDIDERSFVSIAFELELTDALRKAIFKGRVDRVRRLLAFVPTMLDDRNKKSYRLKQPLLEAAVRGNEEIFNLVWENYISSRSSWNDFHFAVTMASLVESELLRKALQRKFPFLGTSRGWDVQIFRAVEVISRPARLAPYISKFESDSCVGELLPCCWHGKMPRAYAVKIGRRDFRGQRWRQETLQRFTSAVLDGDVIKVRNIMKKGTATFFFRGDRLSDYFCEYRSNPYPFSCHQVLSSPFCIAIARNRTEVLCELLSVMDELPSVSQRWISEHSRTVFDIALVHADPTMIRILLCYFQQKEISQFGTNSRLDAALDRIFSTKDLGLLAVESLRQRLTSNWESELRHLCHSRSRVIQSLKLMRRKTLQLIFQEYHPCEANCIIFLKYVFACRFSSALRSILLLQWFKSPLQFLSKQELIRWPKGVAMLFEGGLLVSKDTVRSLRHSCRIAIRGFLRQPIRDSVEKLPLPKKVRKMLVFHFLPVYDFDCDLTLLTVNEG